MQIPNPVDWRPSKPLQNSPFDCGFVCISMLLEMYGHSIDVSRLKEIAGDTSRGLLLSHVLKVLRACGAQADGVAFKKDESESFPSPGIILLKQGHYVVVGRRSANSFEIFDPACGWEEVSRRQMSKAAVGIGVELTGLPSHMERKKKKPPHLWRLVRKALLSSLVQRAILLSVITQVLFLLLPLLTLTMVDKSGHGPTNSFASVAALIFLLTTLAAGALSILSAIINRHLSRGIQIQCATTLYDKLAAKSGKWLESNGEINLYSRFQASFRLQYFYAESAGRVAGAFVLAITGVIAMFYFSPILLIPGLISMSIGVGIDKAFQMRLRESLRRALYTRIQHQSFFSDVIPQINAIQRLGGAWRARVELRRRTKGMAEAEVQSAAIYGAKGAIEMAARGIEQMVFVCLAAYFVVENKGSLGAFVAVGVYKDLLADALRGIFQVFNQQVLLQPQRELVADLEDQPLQTSTTSGAALVNGELNVESVCFQYGTLDAMVLQAVSMRVAPGEVVALSGASGGGKSTLLKLIVGWHAPTSGRITVGQVSARCYLHGLASVLQSDKLLNTSIRKNLEFFRAKKADEELMAILSIVGLREFVLGLPLRLETMVGEESAGLSGGQRQRILIARAILERPKLLVLDEATSSLDVEGERLLLSQLCLLGMTILICSHRPEVWRFANRHYVMDGGVLSELIGST
jgi:ATP-binding cassette, subfamily B, bacterial CvaB/MchF/RaxB